MARLLFVVTLAISVLAGTAPAREFSVDLWDWTEPCRNLDTFNAWAADLKKIGVTRIEISAPWSWLEPRPGEYDLSFIADRLAVAKSLGMGMRVRINSYYQGATPKWYDGDFWRDIDDKEPRGTPVPVSIADERFWHRFAPLCTAIARKFAGEDIYYSPFLGVHAELKWSDWWSYDDATLAKWRQLIRNRPAWLKDVAGDAELPDKPPIPPDTDGTPDNLPVSKAWIAFREQVWRDAMSAFVSALRAGDPKAKISAPLGESFRRESARMSNLDYFGLSRGADQIVHSYDFFWHPKDDPWHAAAAVACFSGITGAQNIAFEFDGPALVKNLDYDEAHQLRIADAALSQGAGLKAANYSYSTDLPSTFPVLLALGRRPAEAGPPVAPDKTVLLFLSKWTNYCYREKTEWLNDAQLGAWHMLTSNGHNVRIICEDNLDEDLGAYRGVYVAFSPPELMPESRREKLAALLGRLPSVVELSEAPPAAPTTQPARGNAQPLPDEWLTLNFPLAYQWTAGDREGCKELLELSLRILSKSKP